MKFTSLFSQVYTINILTRMHVSGDYFACDAAKMNLCDTDLFKQLKGMVHPKMKIKSLITHTHAVPTP